MTSYPIKLYRENDDGFLVLTNGKVGALRKYPFSVNSYVLSSISGHNGAYQIASLTASGTYKLFTGDTLNNLTEDTSWGGDNGIYINVDDNNWTYDGINSVYSTTPSNNVLIGLTGSDANKFAVYGNQSITGNLFVTGTITNPALSSLTAGITLNQYTLTSSFVSATGDLNTRVNSISSSVVSLSSNVGNLNRYTLTSEFIAATASLTGATIFNRSLATGKVTLTNTSNNLQLGGDTGLTGIKLDVQGTTNLGNTITIGALGEKGRITWGSTPQATSFYSLSTNDVAFGTEQSGELIRGTTAGNIGIKTTTPTQPLDVNGAVNLRSALFFGTTGEKGTLTFNTNDFIVRGNGTNNLQLGTNFINVLTVASSLNVGINTTTPTEKLSVSGNISSTGTTKLIGNTSISGTLSNTGFAEFVGASSKISFDPNTGAAGDIPAGGSFYNYGNNFTLLGNPQGTVGHKITICSFNGSTWRSMLETANSSSSEPNLLLTRNGGNVGIGAATPSNKLSISGNVGITGNLISSTATDIGLFALTTGRVGINTSTPSVPLEVNGSMVGGMSFSLGKGSPSASIGFAFNRHFPTGAMYDSSRYGFQFTRPSNSDRFSLEVYNGAGTLITGNAITIDALGNMGILTNAPSTALDINANTMRLRSSRTITNSTDTGNAGDHCWDSNYLYVCVATNTWKRASLSSW